MVRRATLLLITVMAASSLIMISSALAQTITRPSIPEFTAEYVDNSYDIAPTSTTDPYTNETVIQTYGSHVDKRTVVITIKNEPFTPFNDSNGNTINLFYNVRFKGTFGQDWTEMYGHERTVWYSYYVDDSYGYKIQNYGSQNTVVAITSPAKGQMDVQVEALQGYTNRTIVQGHIFMIVFGYTFYGEESGWSDTKTITLGEASTYAITPSPSQLPVPSSLSSTPPEPTTTSSSLPQETLYITLTASIITIIVLLIFSKKRKRV